MAVKTKETILNALLELLEDNELDKITVTDLVEKCQISRQTFYYHFEDLTQLYEWLFASETDKVLKEAIEKNDWARVVLQYVRFLKTYSILLKKAATSSMYEFIYVLMHKSAVTILNYFYDNHPQIKKNYQRDLEFEIKYNAHAFVGCAIDMAVKGDNDYETFAMNVSKFYYDQIKHAIN